MRDKASLNILTILTVLKKWRLINKSKAMKAKSMMKERVAAVIRSGVYADEEALYNDAIRALFDVKMDLKMIAAVELYKE